jgi:ribosomal protein S18 acetylase RimI-like enzyme
MTITIRDGALSDVPVLVDFNAAMAMETESKALDREKLTKGITRLLEERSLGRYFVAVDRDVVGCLMITTEWSDWRNGPFIWIQSVYVRPDARRRGVYRALHHHVIDHAKREGAVGVRLYVEPHNERAIATYSKLGMKKTYDVMETT